jgi:hypothetical protein
MHSEMNFRPDGPPTVVAMPQHSLGDWVAHLRATAGPVATSPPPKMGQIGVPFTAVALGRPAGPVPSPAPPADVGLWWALAGADVNVDELFDGPGDGPLWPQTRFSGVEVWTEAELCGLHALWCLARRRGREDWARRVDTARRWHLARTQPDNATNRPWALHVFLLADPPSPETRLYAETLLHNALVLNGRPDLLSAWILLDSAKRIEESYSSPMHRV